MPSSGRHWRVDNPRLRYFPAILRSGQATAPPRDVYKPLFKRRLHYLGYFLRAYFGDSFGGSGWPYSCARSSLCNHCGCSTGSALKYIVKVKPN